VVELRSLPQNDPTKRVPRKMRLQFGYEADMIITAINVPASTKPYQSMNACLLNQ